ncbi:hypothetical protein [Dysosmobacter sp.]|uniref:hypothetical protein n=1 Tax=Dysosmobacter sp. TaxID=2591382 RepID=UPI003AEF7067
MTLYLYKIGTEKPVLTVENAQSYTADSVTAADGTVYGPLAEGYELSGRADCSQTLRADWRKRCPSQETRLEELEELVAALMFGGEEA